MRNKPKPWYVDFFRDDYQRYWLVGEGAAQTTPERTERQVAFIDETLALPSGASILDLCCGDGRHAVHMAQRGYRVTGLDFSAQPLRLARRAAAKAGVDIEWLRADMRRIPERLTGRFDAVINMFTSFGYLESDAEDEKALDAVARALKPGGKFLIDFLNREPIMRFHTPRDWTMVDDTVLLHSRRFDFVSGRDHDDVLLIAPDGSRRSFSVIMRLYTIAELVQMLRRAGLRFRQVWGDFDGSDIGPLSRRAILLAEKTPDGPGS